VMLNSGLRYGSSLASFSFMTVEELEHAALALSDDERTTLVTRLLRKLPALEHTVSDEEALQRDAELEEGMIEPLSHEDFVRGIESRRRS